MGSILRIRRVVFWSCNCHVREEVSTCFPIFACQTRANFKLLRHFNFVCSPFSILPALYPVSTSSNALFMTCTLSASFYKHFPNMFADLGKVLGDYSSIWNKNKKQATLCFIYETSTHKKFARDSTMRVAF